ncbi:pyridoxal phosphate-dependent aminotransferase [Brevibacterium linens]|uniref:Aminotransferase n=1 Tax=Brevibacterium linens TaxID=1703 RepID=A0A2H1KMM6_BRELN|nr:pyridoxal phosphate-dependent aminotransferase [Brevibacterium linens]SMY00997.1 aspartate aminotransferase [Brevibacterium linens]
MTMHSATLAINETLQAKKAAGEKVLHLGFGEAGLPVPDDVLSCLQNAAGQNSYGAVVGSMDARAEAAGWFSRRDSPTSAEQIIFAPGSKPLLFALLSVLEGDLVLPTPAWVSYAAQAEMVNKTLLRVPIPSEAGGVPDPDLLEDALKKHLAAGGNPGVLLLTVPDNPTGTVASKECVEAVCAVAEAYGLVVISDEIYAEVCHDGSAPSALHYLPERTVVTSGLSKSMALGGWRIGFARVPANDWGRDLMDALVGVASEIWSSLAAPMQSAAAYVLSDPEPVTKHIERARTLHAKVAKAVYDAFTEAGASCRRPSAGFYLYPDFEPVRDRLEAKDITTSEQLADWLLLNHSVGVLPGSAFGDDERGLHARVATSLLYGDTEQQRWEALQADDPVTLPWIQTSLDHLRSALTALTS